MSPAQILWAASTVTGAWAATELIPDWLADLLPAEFVVTATAVAGAIVLLWRVVKKTRPWIRRVALFLEDWFGEPERRDPVSGALLEPARPGVMARLQNVEHEVTTNHGGSMKDAVKRIEGRQAETEVKVQELHDNYIKPKATPPGGLPHSQGGDHD
ncbi:hypothetical protein [Arthrobacter woluwensis]|uniref:hypothetical protein n=1 Tax=Arthrobacter woluwensis TaxID=156980 RepID=UPI001643B472|nr:hypothetical protein [Arthrobacter woluwensis]